MKTEVESAREYEQALMRMRDKRNGMPVKRLAVKLREWPLREWISTRDLARQFQLTCSAVYQRLQRASRAVERRYVMVPLMNDRGKGFQIRVTEWRWKR